MDPDLENVIRLGEGEALAENDDRTDVADFGVDFQAVVAVASVELS